VLALTVAAQRAVRSMLDDAKLGDGAGLRIAGEADAGGEVALEFELAEAPLEGDEVVRSGSAVLFLDEIAAEVLADQTLDVEEHGDHVHFSLDDQTG
jgi:Fe-S cluster assembly iron-binding protein IscA